MYNIIDVDRVTWPINDNVGIVIADVVNVACASLSLTTLVICPVIVKVVVVVNVGPCQCGHGSL